jgi:hypothetical protein
MPSNPLWLDLGSGPEPASDFTGVDFGCEAAPDRTVLHVDLWDGNPWPFESDSIERLRAWHVIEHVPHERIHVGTGMAKVERRRHDKTGKAEKVVVHMPYAITQDAFFWFFDEAYRVAAPGCTFELAWPHPWHEHADQDPTHCRRVPVATLNYLSREGRRALRTHHYPVSCDWRVVPGSVVQIGSDHAMKPFDGILSKDLMGLCVNVFHEIRATLVKPKGTP